MDIFSVCQFNLFMHCVNDSEPICFIPEVKLRYIQFSRFFFFFLENKYTDLNLMEGEKMKVESNKKIIQ